MKRGEEMDVDSMGAGREMDALVAERVFGVPEPSRDERPREHMSVTTHKSGLWWWHYGDSLEGGWHPMPFSEQIGFAWRVVEKVAPRTKWYALCWRPTGAVANFHGDTASETHATFKECGNDREKCQALAVCRAALKVVG